MKAIYYGTQVALSLLVTLQGIFLVVNALDHDWFFAINMIGMLTTIYFMFNIWKSEKHHQEEMLYLKNYEAKLDAELNDLYEKKKLQQEQVLDEKKKLQQAIDRNNAKGA